MNSRTITTVCLFSMLMAGNLQAVSEPVSGSNDSVEWQQLYQWPINGKTIDMVHSLDGKTVFLLNDNNQIQVFTASGKLMGTIPVAEGVSSIDIAPQGEILYLTDSENNSFTAMSISFVEDIDTAGSPFRGPADAPVTVAIFSDFE